MLGKLFSTAASTLTPRSATPGSARHSISLESVQEDIYTRNLLFPDTEALYQHQNDQVFPLPSSTVPLLTSSANPFDINPDIELDLKDVRVVIMQEATSLQLSSALLYDSHPLIEPLPSTDRQSAATSASENGQRSNSGRAITSPRRISLGQASKPVVITHEGSVPRNFGAFDRRPSTHTRAGSYVETEGQRSQREYKEELNTFSNCIFGSSDIMAYKGTGTKVHIIPTEPKASSYTFGDGHGSLGRSSLRSSKLAQSYTSENITSGPSIAGHPGSSSGSRSFEKKKVLITRIFPVPLPNNDVNAAEHPTPTSQTEGSDSSNSYPFPSVGGDAKFPKQKPRQKRTPMYAIGLIVNLSASAHLASTSASRSGFRNPGSYTDQDSFPSSYNSQKPSGWTVLGNGFGVDSLESSVFSDFDDRIDVITQHWDIIMRTLSQLQGVVSTHVLAMLKQVDIASPDPVNLKAMSSHLRTPAASVSVSGKRVDETIKPFKVAGSNAKMVQLLPSALMRQQIIKKEIDDARHRIVSGIKTLQVVTSQGRWGIWREEARWVSRWAGGKHEGFFFYNFLTAFLGNHTEWLRALGPESYRRHLYQQHKSNRDEDTTVSARTVIVSNDKMAARRLIFLLSAFLPPNQQQQCSFNRTYRPSTSISFDGYSQSPPQYLPVVLREESLRRKVKRRNAPPRSTHSRSMSFQTQASNASGGAVQNKEQEFDHRSSDAVSLKTANLPIPGSEGGSRKSSAATTTTVTPATTIPHFSTRRSARGTGPIPRPGSSGNLITDDLIKSLKRGDSTSHFSSGSSESPANSRWGSMISGLWSSKRRDSTNLTDVTPPSVSSSEVIDDGKNEVKRGKLYEMVEEIQKHDRSQSGALKEEIPVGNVKPTPSVLPFTTLDQSENSQQTHQEPRHMYPGGAYESTVKTSINEEDGVIDIDVPLPDFITSSFGSTMSSPSSSGYLSTRGLGPGLENFESYSRRGPDADMPLNVSGWLHRYHPDFTLQAIPPQEQLEVEVKASMSAEATPAVRPTGPGEVSRWVDVSSVLIADATKFSIKRIRCRRHVMLKVSENRVDGPTVYTRSQSLYGNPYGVGAQTDGIHSVIEETFIEDAIISMDEMLIEVVERMISQSSDHQESKPGSSSSSRSTSRVRGREGSDSTATGIPHTGADEQLKLPETYVEVHRGECKKMLLGILEEIARQVADSRHEDPIMKPQVKQAEERESYLREGIRSWLTSVEGW